MKYCTRHQQQQQQYHYFYRSSSSIIFVLLLLILISTNCDHNYSCNWNWKHVSFILYCQSFNIISTTIPRSHTLQQSQNSILRRSQYNRNNNNNQYPQIILPRGTTTTITTTTPIIFQSQLTATKKTSTGKDSKNSKKRLTNGGSNSFGGGGGGFGIGTTTATKTTKTTGTVASSTTTTTTTTTTKEVLANNNNNNQQKDGYDKWGLPLPTIDEIFPPMLNGTIIIPITNNEQDHEHEQEHNTLETIIDSLQTNLYCLQSHHVSNIFHYTNCTLKVPNNNIPIKENNQKQIQDQNQSLPMKIRLLHHTPAVIVIDNFFTQKECNDIERIIDDQQKQNQRSHSLDNTFIQRVNSATFSTSNTDSITKRTSTSWFCNYQLVPTLVAKCCYLFNININQIEEPQIVQYNTGQQFTYHYDIIPNNLLYNGGQRIATVLVYLNTISEQGGGQTIFRDLKSSDGSPLSVCPQQGTALIFFPSIRQQESNGGTSTTFIPDDRTLHKGEIVQDGYTKNIIQLWIHEHSNYTAVLPSSYPNKQSDAIPAVNLVNEQYGYPFL